MKLPDSRGPLSTAVLDALSGRAGLDADAFAASVRDLASGVGIPDGPDLLTHDDLHLALWVLYQLHYRGFEGVAEDAEWDPDLLRARRELETVFEQELRRRAEPHVAASVDGEGHADLDVAGRLFALAESFEGPSVARFVHREATRGQALELLVHRSIYHLKESDPQSFVLPRLDGKPKAALVELQYDEYGGGRADRIHAAMFAAGMKACGLDPEYGAHVDRVPGYTLASDNAMSLLALHRRLRGAAMGHLGAFEATSSLPCRRFAAGLRRLGLPEQVVAYFDEHVEADAVHEQLAFRDICGSLVEQEPGLLGDVFFGAVVCLLMDRVVGERLLDAWTRGRSTLRPRPVAPTPAVA